MDDDCPSGDPRDSKQISILECDREQLGRLIILSTLFLFIKMDPQRPQKLTTHKDRASYAHVFFQADMVRLASSYARSWRTQAVNFSEKSEDGEGSMLRILSVHSEL